MRYGIMKICDEDLCIGCMACKNVCMNNAIEIVQNKQGFYKPLVNDTKCTGCNLCSSVCVNNISLDKVDTYLNQAENAIAAWSKSSTLRKQSTSGGAFSVLASAILAQNGIVFGAAYDSGSGMVKHISVDKVDDLYQLRGSKYVQSYIGDIYKKVKQELQSGRKVLFSGTPCQIFGLRQYLGRYTDNLYTIDLVCHGVPSPRVFKDYCTYISESHQSSIKGVNFRHKKPGWKVFGMKVSFHKGADYESDTKNDPYLVGFLRDYFLNAGCHVCKFAKAKRPGDITLADFWGYYDDTYRYIDDDKGISLVLLNTDRGKELFSEVKDNLIWKYKPIEDAVQGNPCLSHSFPRNDKYEEFWNDYENMTFQYICDKYFYPDTPQHFTIREKIMQMFSVRQKYIIKKILFWKYIKSKLM